MPVKFYITNGAAANATAPFVMLILYKASKLFQNHYRYMTFYS